MINDLILEKFVAKEKKDIWGRYSHVYGWFWNKDINKPTIYPLSLEDSERTGMVMIRDWMIAQKLSRLGIKKVLDIGSDTGHLMAVLKSCGIEAVGIDSNKSACDYINSRNVSKCYNLSIQDLIELENIADGYDCVICLNITQAKWKDELLKDSFISWISDRFEYCVLSNYTRQDRGWNKLNLIHCFNVGRFKYNKILQYLYNKILQIDTQIHYISIQKIYKSKVCKGNNSYKI